LIIRFSRHALEKARRRGVHIQHVRKTLGHPDVLYEDVEHNVMIAIKNVNEKSIILVYKRDGGLVKVITLYYTTKLDKLVESKTVRGAWRKVK